MLACLSFGCNMLVFSCASVIQIKYGYVSENSNVQEAGTLAIGSSTGLVPIGPDIWHQLTLRINPADGQASLDIDNVAIGSFAYHFPAVPRGGPLVINGHGATTEFTNFAISL